MSYVVPAGQSGVGVRRVAHRPGPTSAFTLDEDSYAAARQALATFWARKLAGGATFEVPEVRVQNAARSLVIQNLALAWRYSAGNGYHSHFFTPEAVDTAGVMGEYGFQDVDRATLDVASWRKLGWTANWRMGARLLGTARYYGLFPRRRLSRRARRRRSRRYVDAPAAPAPRPSLRLLRRERFSADVLAQGLRAPLAGGRVAGTARDGGGLGRDGPPGARGAHARRSRELGAGCARAAQQSARRMGDGSLFIPIRLLDGERPYRRLTASRPGSYWNLVMPYALASGLFPPDGRERKACSGTCCAHGSRLLGARPRRRLLALRHAGVADSGTDQVYGLNVARFLADRDEADQLVLSLYGQLAAGMTRGHLRLGRGRHRRAAPRRLLPLDVPAAELGEQLRFLETLRLMLVHETRGRATARRAASSSRSRRRARGSQPGEQIAVRRRADELRPALVHRRGEGRRGRRVGRRPGVPLAQDAEAPAPPAARPAASCTSTSTGSRRAFDAGDGNDRPQRPQRQPLRAGELHASSRGR